MPIRVDYQNNPLERCTIRPTPFVQISTNTLRNKKGKFGVTYTITLTGTLLPDEGTPYAVNPQNMGDDQIPQKFPFFQNQATAESLGFEYVGP